MSSSHLHAAILTAFAAFSSMAHAEDNVPYGRVHVRDITYAGSGCPAGSVSTNISSDSQGFSLIFDEMIAEAGLGIPLSSSRKNCSITLDIAHPQGWSYALKTVDFNGYVSLQPGATATHKVSAYFQGQGATANLQTTFRGPTDRDYTVRDTLGTSALVWSPCGAQRALSLNTQIRVEALRGSSGLITVDGRDFPQGNFRFVWRRCW